MADQQHESYLALSREDRLGVAAQTDPARNTGLVAVERRTTKHSRASRLAVCKNPPTMPVRCFILNVGASNVGASHSYRRAVAWAVCA